MTGKKEEKMFHTLEDVLNDFYRMGHRRHLGRRLVSFPAVNIYEADDHFLVTAQVPGVKKEDIEVTVIGDILTIQGKADAEKEDVSYYSRERNLGTFHKDVQIPFVMSASDPIDAQLRDGLLQIKLPVPAESKPRKISIVS